MVGDETSHILGWNIKNGWYPRERPVTTPVSLSRNRFHSIGALSEDTLYCAFYDKANSENYCDFLRQLHREFGKVLLFLDNASYHKSKAVNECLREMGGDVQIRYFLPYTPELNPIEGQWRIVKKATANTLYENTSDMANAIWRMIMGGEIIKAKMSHYLAP